MKVCKKCGAEKPETEFRIDRIYVKGECKECERKAQKERYRQNPEKGAAAARKWGRENPKRRNATKLAWHHKNKTRVNLMRRVRAYGITIEGYNQMVITQQNCCACCHREFEGTPEIDHCHKTGIVRGLLCISCNTGLGLFQDSDIALLQAISYLKKFQG